MSGLVSVRVELPSHARTFFVSVGPDGDVKSLKTAISRDCEGHPRADGQRLIYKGRLLQDDESLEALWKDEPEPRSITVHLAVNASAWETPPQLSPVPPLSLPSVGSAQNNPTPPNVLLPSALPGSPIASSSITVPTTHLSLSPQYSSHPQGSSIPTSYVSSGPSPTAHSKGPPPAYIVFQHNNALRVLLHIALHPVRDQVQLNAAKEHSRSLVRATGRAWPPVLDELLSGDPTGDEGVKYTNTFVEGKPFLRNITPEATPTELQSKALEILTYTFPLLVIRITENLSQQNRRPPVAPGAGLPGANGGAEQLDARLAALNAQVLRLRNQGDAGLQALGAQGQRVAVRIPLRPMVMPLIFLLLRTAIMMYLFAPTHRPVFATLIILWVIYEAYTALRGAMNALAALEAPLANAGVAPGAPAAPNAGANNNQGQGQGPHPPAPPVQGPAANNAPQDAAARAGDAADGQPVIERLAQLNLPEEDIALFGPADGAVNEVSFVDKAKTFVALFVLTLHPAFWDARRATLRRREGRIRTEANAQRQQQERQPAPQPAPEGETEETQAGEGIVEEPQRRFGEDRAPWIRAYIDRVMVDDWET